MASYHLRKESDYESYLPKRSAFPPLTIQFLSSSNGFSTIIVNNCRDICMESTGKYWVPVFNLLEDEINVVIANPKWVKAVKGNKDDTKDSKWIGDLFRLGLVKGSYIPCKIVRILREYTRYRYKLVSCRSSEKNRYQNALTVCNVALDSVVSDIFGKSSTSIIDYLLEQSGTSINHEEIASKLLRSLKSKEDAVIESVEGYQMTDAQKYRMRLVRAHMDYITAEINDVDKMIENMISSNPDFENAVQFLCTIPGVKRDSAITIISEIGTDMSQFSSSKRLCSTAYLSAPIYGFPLLSFTLTSIIRNLIECAP